MKKDSSRLPVGFTEAVAVLAGIGTFLTARFGHDWGVATVTQEISALGPVVIPIVVAYYRLGKHEVRAQVVVATLNTPIPPVDPEKAPVPLLPGTIPVVARAPYTGPLPEM